MAKEKSKGLINVEHEEKIDQAEVERLERAKRREEAQPKKAAKTLPVEEREGHAVVTVAVPARDEEVVIGHSNIPGVIDATVAAWHVVKGNDDAEFARCVAEHRRDLINHAEEVFQTGITTEGDTIMAQFERAVAKFKIKAEEAAAKAA